MNLTLVDTDILIDLSLDDARAAIPVLGEDKGQSNFRIYFRKHVADYTGLRCLI